MGAEFPMRLVKPLWILCGIGAKDVHYRNEASALAWTGTEHINRFRQSGKLVIAFDHGHAVSRLFLSKEIDPGVVKPLREPFGAARSKKANRP